MSSYYYIPGTNIINPEIQNIIDSFSQLENIPTFELNTQSDIDISSNLFTLSVFGNLLGFPI